MAYYNCLLIDTDGTLLDFEASQRKALAAALGQFGIPAEEAVLALYARINGELWRALERGEIRREKLYRERFVRLLRQLALTGDPEALSRAYEQALAGQADLMPGALEAVRELSEVATLAVVTNGFEKVQRSRLALSGLDKYMDGIYISEKMGANKPARRFFEGVLKDLGIEHREKVLVIGDSLKADVEGAKNAGLAACWFCPGGFEKAPRPAPDHMVGDLRELYPIVMEEDELANVGSEHRKHQDLVGLPRP